MFNSANVNKLTELDKSEHDLIIALELYVKPIFLNYD